LEHGKPVEQEQFQQQMDAADERGQQGASAPSATAEPATKPDGMLCSFKGCLKPLGVPGAPGFQKIFHITTSTKAGEQDWSNLLGMTLCKACYYRFSRSGCLEGGPSRVDPISRTRGSHERVLNQGRLPVRGRPGLRSSAFASSAAGTSVFGEAAAHCTYVEREGGGHQPPSESSGPHAGAKLPSSALNLPRPSSFLESNEYISTDTESDSHGDDNMTEDAGSNTAAPLRTKPDVLAASKKLITACMCTHTHTHIFFVISVWHSLYDCMIITHTHKP